VDTKTARDIVVAAFDKKNYCYYHTSEHKPKSFIDGMAWAGVCCGAALKVKDKELADFCAGFLANLLLVGKDARNYAQSQPDSDWIPSTTMPGFWYLKKAQSFAGPAGLQFAIDNGAKLETPFKDVKKTAKWMCAGGWLFGLSVKFLSSLRQHINSMFTAYLILGKKPSSTMLWMCEENPYFSYVAGKKCAVAYPPTRRFANGQEKTSKKVVQFQKAEPSAWVFRRDPFNEYCDAGSGQLMPYDYTPIAQVVGDYLQKTL